MNIIRDTSGSIRQVVISGLHGDAARPIIIDGNWMSVDGDGTHGPLVIRDCSHIVVQRFLAHNAKTKAATLHCESCHDMVIRECLAWDAGDGNAFPFLVWKSQRVRTEDCAAWGRGRKVWQWYMCDDCTAVRCFGRWGRMTTPDPGSCGVFAPSYNSFRTTMTDCIGVVEGDDQRIVNGVWIADQMNYGTWVGKPAEAVVDGCLAISIPPRDAFHIGWPERAITYTNCVRNTPAPIVPASNAGVDAASLEGRRLLERLRQRWDGSPLLALIAEHAGVDVSRHIAASKQESIEVV